jgi:hypothetical protein
MCGEPRSPIPVVDQAALALLSLSSLANCDHSAICRWFRLTSGNQINYFTG